MNFDVNVTKADAFFCEFGYPMPRGGGEALPMQPLTFYGYVVKMGPRLVNGTADIYETGHPRIRFYYPAFGVHKYSLRSDAAGDILNGHKSTLFGGRRWFPPKDARVTEGRMSNRRPLPALCICLAL